MFRMMFTVLLLLVVGAPAQVNVKPAFEVVSIKPVDAQPKDGRFLTMQGVNQFVAKNYPLRLLIAAAYSLNPKAITGGPSWIDSKFDIHAVTPGEIRPTRDLQMEMLAGLLQERFQLVFHREQKEFAIYTLTIAKSGDKLKPSGASASDPSSVISTVYPDRILIPA